MKIIKQNLFLVLFLLILLTTLSVKLNRLLTNSEISEDYNFIIIDTESIISKSDLFEINFVKNNWVLIPHIKDIFLNSKKVETSKQKVNNGDTFSFDNLDFELYTAPKSFYYRKIFNAYNSDLNNRTLHIGYDLAKASIIIDKTKSNDSIPDIIGSLTFTEDKLVLYPTYANSSKYLFSYQDNLLHTINTPIELENKSIIFIKIGEKVIELKIEYEKLLRKMYYKYPNANHSTSDYLVNDHKISISIRDKNDISLEQLSRTASLIFNNPSGLQYVKQLSKNKKNIIVSQNKLLKPIDFRKNAIVPNSVSLAIFKEDYENTLLLFKSKYLENNKTFDFNNSVGCELDVMIDSIFSDRKLKKMNSPHKKAIKPLLRNFIGEIQSLIYQPGISATFAIYDKETSSQRFVTTDESWDVSFNGSKENAVSHNRDIYFKRNFGSFISFPLLITPPDNIQREFIFEPENFYLNENEIVSYAKICATGKYSLRGFNHEITGDFSDRNKKIIINSAPTRDIIISISNNSSSVKLFHDPYLLGHIEISNINYQTNHDWKCSLNSFKPPKIFSDNLRNISENNFDSNFLQSVEVDLINVNKISLPFQQDNFDISQAFYYLRYSNPNRSPIKYKFNNDVYVYEVRDNQWRQVNNGDIISPSGLLAVQIKPFISPLSPTNNLALLHQGKIKDITISRSVFSKTSMMLPNIYDREGDSLAWSSPDFKRHYANVPSINSLLGFYDNDSKQTIGLETYFKSLSSKYKNQIIDITTTINTPWQQEATKLLENYVNQYQFDKGELINDKNEPWGAFLLTNDDGEILVSASYPSIDETIINNQQTQDNFLVDLTYDRNIAGFNNRYINHNFKTSSTPGSTLKLINAMTLLHIDSLLVENDERLAYIDILLNNDFTNNPNLYNNKHQWKNINGKSYIFAPDKKIRLSHKNSNNMNMHFSPRDNNLQKALSNSYNTYFSYTMLHLNLDYINYIRDIQNLYPKGYCLLEDDYFNYPFNYWRDKLLFNERLTYAGKLTDEDGKDFVLDDTVANDLLVTSSYLPKHNLFSWDFVQAAVGDVTPSFTNFQQIAILSLINEGQIKLPFLFKSIKIGDDVFTGQSITINNNIVNYNMPILKDYIGHKYSNQIGTVYAKTGTSTISNIKKLNNSWFVGIWEYNDETYYFSIVLNSTHATSSQAVEMFNEFRNRIIR